MTLQLATEMNSRSYLLFGLTGAGKSTNAIQLAEGKTLVLSFSNVDRFIGLENFTVAFCSDEAEFAKDLAEARKHQWDTVILDGYDKFVGIMMDAMSTSVIDGKVVVGKEPTQADWSKMTRSVLTYLIQVRALAPLFICCLETKIKEANGLSFEAFALNPYLKGRLVGFFGNKYYCWRSSTSKVENGKTVVTSKYGVNKDAASSLEFKKG